MAYLLSGLADQIAIPGGFWEFIWSNILLNSGSPFALIVNYGLRVVIFTIALKLLLSPLDIYQRVRQRKNQRIIESLKPETEKLEKQFSSQPQVLQKKKQELNKKNGVKMAAGCVPMAITMLVSLWVLMGGLNPISQYQNMAQYLKLYDAFVYAERATMVDRANGIGADGEVSLFFESYDNLPNSYFFIFRNQAGETVASDSDAVHSVVLRPVEAFNFDGATDAEARARRNQIQAWISREATSIAQVAVYHRYIGYGEWYGNPARESFLWVRNIWVSDVFWQDSIRDAASFRGSLGRFSDPDNMGLLSEENLAAAGMTADQFRDYFEHSVIGSYDRVMGYLLTSDANRANGFLILPILSIIVMVGSQILMRRLQKKSGQDGGMPGMPGMGGGAMGGMGGSMGKIMQFAMPVVFGLFSLGFTAAFALYMVVNSMLTIVITLASMGFMKLMDMRASKETMTSDGVVRYGRKDPNEAPIKPADTRKNRKNK